MATFTKDDLLNLCPCCPWPIEIKQWDKETFDGQDILDRLEELGSEEFVVWLMGSSVALATEFVEECSVDTNLPGIQQKAALHFAVILNKIDVITYLKGKGASSNVKDKFNRSPMDIAISLHNDAAIEALGG